MSQSPYTEPLPEVLIMAGGEGRRLGPLTTRIPKPMLPVGGRPVLQHALEQLREQGVGHVFLSVRHLSHVISDYFGDGRWLGLDIDYIVEQQALGSAGAIGLLPAQSKPLLVLNGDLVTTLPLGALCAHHRQHDAAMTIAYVEQTVSVAYGVIECVGPDVVQLQEKPDLVLTVIAGVYVIAPEITAGVHRGVPLDMPDLIGAVLGSARVVGFPLPGPWLDIGTPDTYSCADQVAASAAAMRPSPPTSRAPTNAVAPVFTGAITGDRPR